MKDALGSMIAFVLIGGAAAMYIANVIKLVMSDGPIGLLIARAIGILVFPLGIVLGFVG